MLNHIETKNWYLDIKTKYLQISILALKLYQQSEDEEFLTYYEDFTQKSKSLENKISELS